MGYGHVSSCYSIADVVAVMFTSGIVKQFADVFFMSKGHAVGVLGWLLDTMDVSAVGKIRDSHGSLGMGLGICCGIAYAHRQAVFDETKVFCVLGDGECQEGSVWEAAMWAGTRNLSNLVVIVDRNGLGATDYTERMAELEPLAHKWEAFGWGVQVVNGHDYAEIEMALRDAVRPEVKKPQVIICNTIKGQGADCLQGSPLCHGRVPSDVDADIIRLSLEGGADVDA